MLERLSVEARKAVARSVELAGRFGDDAVSPAHILLALVSSPGDPDVASALQRAGTAASDLREALRRGRPERTELPAPLSRHEQAELVRDLRRRGVPRGAVPRIVERIQRERSIGPAELDDDARAAVRRALADAGAEALEAVGVDVGALRDALAPG